MSDESHVEWCKRMQDEAIKVEEAIAYYELAKMWMEREKKSNG